MKVFAQVADEHIIGWEVVPCGPDLILSRGNVLNASLHGPKELKRCGGQQITGCNVRRSDFAGHFPFINRPLRDPHRQRANSGT